MPHFKQLSVLRDARAVTASHHKGLLRQAIEIVRMKKRNPGLGASDYFAFRLYDEDYLGTSRPEDFVGWREEGDVALILNARSGVAPAWAVASGARLSAAMLTAVRTARRFIFLPMSRAAPSGDRPAGVGNENSESGSHVKPGGRETRGYRHCGGTNDRFA